LGAEQAASQGTGAASAGRVLLVEDNEVVGYLLQHILQHNGVDTHWVRDGRAAWDLIDDGEPPAVVLMDVALPYIDGFELLEHLRASPRWGRVPVFVLTAKGKPADRARALSFGATAYYVKPMDPDEVLAIVRGALEKQPS
jgi:two-component system, chemotaxis family, sensor kinase CheA